MNKSLPTLAGPNRPYRHRKLGAGSAMSAQVSFVQALMISASVVLLVPAQLQAQEAPTKTFTANDLDFMCKDDRNEIGHSFCAGFLFGLKTGIARAPAMLQAGFGCIPPAASPQQLRTIVEQYINQHPENRNEDGRTTAIAAIGLAFPCSGGAAGPVTQTPPQNFATENATDICARRCLPPGGFHAPPGGGIVTGLPPSADACLRACGDEMGRNPR